MTDHEDLIRRLGAPDEQNESLRELCLRSYYAIKGLMAECDEMHDALATAYLAGAKEWKDRAEKAEEIADLSSGVIHKLKADLAVARAALREYAHWYGTVLDQVHAPAIAAARADGGE